jgi:hypothetical protein
MAEFSYDGDLELSPRDILKKCSVQEKEELYTLLHKERGLPEGVRKSVYPYPVENEGCRIILTPTVYDQCKFATLLELWQKYEWEDLQRLILPKNIEWDDDTSIYLMMGEYDECTCHDSGQCQYDNYDIMTGRPKTTKCFSCPSYYNDLSDETDY